ncbi:Dbl domain-containing protein [Moniliophthora roreri]|nr:Dbl domain-containing protein [Moniliophthora roreri]
MASLVGCALSRKARTTASRTVAIVDFWHAVRSSSTEAALIPMSTSQYMVTSTSPKDTVDMAAYQLEDRVDVLSGKS